MYNDKGKPEGMWHFRKGGLLSLCCVSLTDSVSRLERPVGVLLKI